MDPFIIRSRISRKNGVYTIAGLTGILFLLAGDMYRWFFLKIYSPVELLLVSVLMLAYIERIGARYTYIADDATLNITKRGLLGTKHYEIAYPKILGIYQYKAKLVSVIQFRRTFRLHSALDDREVWTLAYRVETKDGSTENARIYFKPGDELLDFIAKYVPKRVRISEETVVQESLRRS